MEERTRTHVGTPCSACGRPRLTGQTHFGVVRRCSDPEMKFLGPKECLVPRPPVVPSFRRWDWGGCQEGPVIPNLKKYDWRCREYDVLDHE